MPTNYAGDTTIAFWLFVGFLMCPLVVWLTYRDELKRKKR